MLFDNHSYNSPYFSYYLLIHLTQKKFFNKMSELEKIYQDYNSYVNYSKKGRSILKMSDKWKWDEEEEDNLENYNTFERFKEHRSKPIEFSKEDNPKFDKPKRKLKTIEDDE